MEGQELSLSQRRQEKVTHCIFGRNFLSLCSTIALGTENYPNVDCSNNVAQLLPCLDL